MEKKYKLSNNTIKYKGITLHRIEALKNFGDVKAGDLGGFVLWNTPCYIDQWLI